MDAILSNLDAANNLAAGAAPPSSGFAGLLLDHSRRIIRAANGFGVYGASWLRPWVTYCVSPLLNRVAGGRIAQFNDFKVRLGECDLYTFANIFEDYPVRDIERALNEVGLIVDLGANVGAFSCLVAALCRRHELDHPIVAVEPNTANVEFLRQQPFAGAISIRHAAVGAANGTARLVPGHNSVSDYVDFSGRIVGYGLGHLSDLGNYDWRLSPKNVWKVENYLREIPHRAIRSSDRMSADRPGGLRFRATRRRAQILHR